jgi:hypothetical protein
MFKAAEGTNFHGYLSAVQRRIVQEDFVFRYKYVVKSRKRILTFTSIEKFPALQEIFSWQITQISDPSRFVFHRPVLIISVRQRFHSEKCNQARCFPQPADLLLRLENVVGEEIVSVTRYPRANIEKFLDCYPKWRE